MRVSLLKRAAFVGVLFVAGSSLALAQPDIFSYGGGSVPIPDNTYDGSAGSMACVSLDNSGGVVVDITDVEMDMEITHTWVGDLTVKITSPAGTLTTAMATPGQLGVADDGSTCCGTNADLDGTPINFANFNPFDAEDMGLAGDPVCSGAGGDCDYFPNPDGAPGSDFDDFLAESAIGMWTICVGDGAGGDTGDILDFTLIVGGFIPVELVSFTGTANGTDVALNWETASETNNAGFEVQMQDGENWNALGFVDGHGTTTEAQTYSFTAGDIPIGTHAFRLKQIDFDGVFEYSGEVEVTIETPGSHVLSSAYPNPFNPQSQFTLAVAQEQHVTAELFNTLGQRVAVLFNGTVEANQSQLVTIDGAGLASGTYVVLVNGENFSDALSVTLLK